MLASCIDNDIPYPIVVANIVEFEVDGQVGEAQINTETRTVSFEVADTIDLQHMRITKFKLNKEAHPAAVGVGSIISCVDSIELMLETYQVYRWVLISKQQFTPEVKLTGQQGDISITDDTIRVNVKSISQAAIEDLRLAPGNATYNIDIDTITDFSKPIEIVVTSYGKTKIYVLVVVKIINVNGLSLLDFEIDGQDGESKIDANKRTVSINMPETADLMHLQLSKLTLSEDDATASLIVGEELACIDSIPFTISDVDGDAYEWKLHVHQQFTPVVRLKGQLPGYTMNKDTITVYVKNASKTAIEELRLAPEVSNPTYSPVLSNLTDFSNPVEITVTSYGREKTYVIKAISIGGAEGPSVTEFEVDGQVGAAQINANKRTVSIEMPETANLLHLMLSKLTLSEPNATASLVVGEELACIDSIPFVITDADSYTYQWKLHVRQQFTPVVRLKGQLGGYTINNGIIRVFVDDVATTYIEELILAPAVGNPSYSPNPANITDFSQPVKIDVTAYGKTTSYTLEVSGMAGYPCGHPVISITTGNASPQITTATIEAEVAACSAVLPYFEYRKQGDTQWISTPQGYAEAGATAYTATLDGLEPNTTYEYRAVANGTEGDVRTFTTNPDPIQTITTVEAVTSGRTAELKANVVCLETVQVHFEYRAFGATDWLSTPATSASAVATIATTIDGLEYSTDYEFRAVATSSIGRREGAIMQFRTPVNPVQSITTSGADPWAKFAHVSAEAMCTQASVALGFEYSKQGTGNWIPSTTKASTIGSNTYTITLTGLEPNTTYEYRAVAGGLTGESKSFTTDGAPTVPNLSFDDWDDSQKNGGRVSWRPWSGGNTTTFWNTGNSGVTPGGLSGPGKQSNNTPVEGTDAKSGKAAMLKSIKLGALASTFGGVGFAAGSIFSGDYATNTSNPPTSVKMGHAYTGRPTQLKGWYKYSPQNINEVNSKFYNGGSVSGSDKMHIYIYLLDWSNRSNKYVDAYEGIFKYVKQNRMIVNEPPVYEAPPLKNGKKLPAEELVAYGEFLSDQTVSSYTQFTINLEYYSTTKRPTHIIICATSSYLGSAFTGGENSTLWVDDFELGFDYVEP